MGSDGAGEEGGVGKGLDGIIPAHSCPQGSSLADFQVLSELGRGTYGVVLRVKSLRDGRVYVLKRIRIGHLKPARQREVFQEATVLRRVRHAHVIGYYTSFVEKKSLFILMEHAANGDLSHLLDQHKKEKSFVPEKTLWRILFELAQAMQHLHTLKIVHRDIKLVNVFLDADDSVKLGDLGVSRLLNGEGEMAQSRVGTPLYLAPELIRRQPYDFKADVWALGVLMYNMAALRGPFLGDNIYALGYSIIHDAPALLPGVYTKPLTSLVFAMLEKEQAHRPTMANILAKLPSHMPSDLLPKVYPAPPTLSQPRPAPSALAPRGALRPGEV
ncbi:kinase-like domain-containing protein [Baffinella frigidus]|nr:kinase-like domain-containing protein [Cryptophyta sp. CCMP2293]